jgi:hypothetical protein
VEQHGLGVDFERLKRHRTSIVCGLSSQNPG